MKFSLSWVRDHLDGDAPERRPSWPSGCTAAGMNVELRERERSADDEVWDVDVTTNRPDAMNHRGLAREAAAAGCGTLKPLAVRRDRGRDRRSASSRRSPSRTRPGARATAPASSAASRSGPSPAWLAARLERCGIRPINNVVDATNYVLLDVGHPLHAFDLALLLAGTRSACAAPAPARAITTLDGVEPHADGRGPRDRRRRRAPVAVAGVMGGADTRDQPAPPATC